MNYSPLRYPGGKSKLAPLIDKIINNTGSICNTYIEPFAGGAGVALTLLLSNKVRQIVINDYDKAIYSFWRSLKEETNELINLIKKTPLSIVEWKKQRNIYINENKKYSLKLGFAAFYLNRTNRSGVLTGGVIGGLEQNSNYSIDARYNKTDLISRIEKIAERKCDIKIYNKEIRSFITNIIPKYQKDGFVYFDPPYYNKGKCLYKNFFIPKDHAEIANLIINKVKCDWVITYDNVPQIKELFQAYSMRELLLRYHITNNRNLGEELLILKKNKYYHAKSQLHYKAFGGLNV